MAGKRERAVLEELRERDKSAASVRAEAPGPGPGAVGVGRALNFSRLGCRDAGWPSLTALWCYARTGNLAPAAHDNKAHVHVDSACYCALETCTRLECAVLRAGLDARKEKTTWQTALCPHSQRTGFTSRNELVSLQAP